MKHKFLLSALTALIIFAATATAEAGIFGRLSVVWNGCNPCEPVACQPCEPIVACDPCAVVSVPDPCDPCGIGCGPRPFRPFGGLFANAKARLAVSKCAPIDCNPCAVVVDCDPCAVVCAPDPCDPCGTGCGPVVRLPFNGFFRNLFSSRSGCFTDCGPCEPVCDPCAACL